MPWNPMGPHYESFEKNALLARTAPVAMEGKFEKFNTSDFFDSTAKHPEWLTAKRM